ncbi:UNVERIFIED_CONTAM: Pentatricopeptide repeat-containing protein, mitochondrial [Sesamum latifolium]|uniref:Pentatricopeptide repeat-containing protein, mitochondrial n=1 Tax=Sesamum latifolium TaxID=2727402 RepID=A0AAW2X3Q6_9LAMI
MQENPFPPTARSNAERTHFVCEGALIDMYAKCRHLMVAKRIFDDALKTDIVSCTALISEIAQVGLTKEAMEVFEEMQKQLWLASPYLGCEARVDSNVYAGSSLINMYAKCQKMEAAKAVFNGLEEKNNVLLSALLGGYAQNGHAHEVLELFF